MTVVLAKRSDKPHARPRGRLHPTDNGDGADAGRSSMAPRQVPVPLRAARQGTQHSGTKLLSQPRHLIESRFMLRCRPLSISDTAPVNSRQARGNFYVPTAKATKTLGRGPLRAP